MSEVTGWRLPECFHLARAVCWKPGSFTCKQSRTKSLACPGPWAHPAALALIGGGPRAASALGLPQPSLSPLVLLLASFTRRVVPVCPLRAFEFVCHPHPRLCCEVHRIPEQEGAGSPAASGFISHPSLLDPLLSRGRPTKCLPSLVLQVLLLKRQERLGQCRPAPSDPVTTFTRGS